MRPVLVSLVLATAAGCGAAAVEHNAAKASTRLDLAKDFLRKHQLEAAHAESNRSLKLNPSNEEALNVRGLVSVVEAIDAQRTLEIDSCLTGVDAEATRGELEKFLMKADKDFGKATELNPEYGEAWSNRGVVRMLLEDHGSAEKFFLHALENPMRLDSPGLTRSHLGWALFQNKLPEAAKELRQAMQFQPKMCVATYRLARVYFAREEWEKAAELFQTVSDDPSCGSQEAAFYLMKTRLLQGLVYDARHARDACLKISPRSCIAAKCRADGGALGGATHIGAHP